MTDKIEIEDNDKDTLEFCSAEFRLINKIIKAEQRIADGETYMEISELKEKLDLK